MSAGEIRSRWLNYIDGEWTSGAEGRWIEVEDPARAQPLAEAARAEAADVDRAVRAARRAFGDRTLCGLSPPDRADLMRRIAVELRALSEEIAWAECLDNGKPISAARGEAAASARYFDYYAGLADKLEGRSIPLGDGYVDYTVYEPYGVTAHVVPWNYPLQLAVRSTSCALAAGNSVVVKAPAVSPLSVLLLGEAFERAGVPAGAANIVCGRGSDAGRALISHPETDHIVFTGSAETGRRIMTAAADRVRPVVLELGGKSAGVVLADADLEMTARDVMIGAFTNSGQICSAESRLLVQRDVYDDLLDLLSDKVKSLSIGPGREDHDITPLISAERVAEVTEHCRRAQGDGVKTICGGRPASDLAGHFFEPTIFADVDPSLPIAHEEVFGPVLVVTPFSDPDEAVALANGTPYGLAAGVYTRDLSRALSLAGRLDAGQVFVNQWYAGGVETPFGGNKMSGFGREKGREGLFNYVRTKNVAVRLDSA